MDGDQVHCAKLKNQGSLEISSMMSSVPPFYEGKVTVIDRKQT